MNLNATANLSLFERDFSVILSFVEVDDLLSSHM